MRMLEIVLKDNINAYVHYNEITICMKPCGEQDYELAPGAEY